MNRYAVINECCCCSFIKSCPILCSLKDCNTPGFLPSLSPGVCSNSCLMSQWCHATISSSVIPFSSYLQSFLASGFSPMSQLFTAGGQSIGASAAVLPMNIQGWFSLGLTDLISCNPRDSQESSSAPQFESVCSSVLILLYGPTLISYMITEKIIALTIWTFVRKVMSFFFLICCLRLS